MASATSRDHAPMLERLAIDGVVWGTGDGVDRRADRTSWSRSRPGPARCRSRRSLTAGNRGATGSLTQAVRDRIDDLARADARQSAGCSATRSRSSARRVITGTDAPPISNATIVIRDGRIAAVGPSASTPVPRGVPSVDRRGQDDHPRPLGHARARVADRLGARVSRERRDDDPRHGRGRGVPRRDSRRDRFGQGARPAVSARRSRRRPGPARVRRGRRGRHRTKAVAVVAPVPRRTTSSR